MMEQLQLDLDPVKTSGQIHVQRVLDSIVRNPIEDAILKGGQISFSTYDRLLLHGAGKTYELHKHAFGQLCSRLHIPQDYVSRLLRTQALKDLAEWNLSELMARQETETRFLLRSVREAKRNQNVIRGFLSTSYKRLNTPELISAFSCACGRAGATPFWGYISDLQMAVLATLPKRWRISDRDVSVGVILEHSDFGARALEVQFFLWDCGLIIGRKGLRRIHLGKRISNVEDSSSAITRKVGEEIISMVLQHLEPTNIEATMAELQLLAERIVDVDKVTSILSSLPLSEEEIGKTVDLFLSYHTHSVYHIAAALAWVGRGIQDPDRQLILGELAGSLLIPAATRNKKNVRSR